MTLDDWQEWILRSAMGERGDGTWSAKQVGISVPRQNGKSQLIVARALAGALLFGEKKIVISAHAQDTARETFGKFLEIRDESPALDERIEQVMTALNREFIKFTNGATIQFKTRTKTGTRGFSCDCLLLDEAQILGMPAWVSINSTMSARPNPQVWLLGTPPTPEDSGEVFTSIRSAAIEGRSTALSWQEWGAAPGSDPALVSTRAAANPAWSMRINHEIVQGEFETYPPDRFAQDRLGQWRDEMVDKVDVFGVGNWSGCARPDYQPDGDPVLGVAVAVDRTWASIASAALVEVEDADDPEAEPNARVFVTATDRRPEVGWLVAELKRIQDATDCVIVIDEKGPTEALLKDLEDADVAVETLSFAEYAEACSRFFDKVRGGQVLHPSSTELDEAVAGATTRTVNGRLLWDRKKSAVDVSMLEAATLAAYGAEKFGW